MRPGGSYVAPLGGSLSTLFLARHGQTRGFLTGSYTDLTDLGVAQARGFGAWLAAMQVQPDRVFVGPRDRHQQTHDHARAASGMDWPAAVRLTDLDEHHGFEVVAHLLSGEGGALGDELRAAVITQDRVQILRAFRDMMHAWARGDVRAPQGEDWDAFRVRVARGLDTLCDAAANGQTVLAFTSGGFVGVASATLLGLGGPASTVDLAFSVDNTAFSEVRFSADRRTLYRFNAAPHARADMPLTGI